MESLSQITTAAVSTVDEDDAEVFYNKEFVNKCKPFAIINSLTKSSFYFSLPVQDFRGSSRLDRTLDQRLEAQCNSISCVI